MVIHSIIVSCERCDRDRPEVSHPLVATAVIRTAETELHLLHALNSAHPIFESTSRYQLWRPDSTYRGTVDVMLPRYGIETISLLRVCTDQMRNYSLHLFVACIIIELRHDGTRTSSGLPGETWRASQMLLASKLCAILYCPSLSCHRGSAVRASGALSHWHIIRAGVDSSAVSTQLRGRKALQRWQRHLRSLVWKR